MHAGVLDFLTMHKICSLSLLCIVLQNVGHFQRLFVCGLSELGTDQCTVVRDGTVHWQYKEEE